MRDAIQEASKQPLGFALGPYSCMVIVTPKTCHPRVSKTTAEEAKVQSQA